MPVIIMNYLNNLKLKDMNPSAYCKECEKWVPLKEFEKNHVEHN